MKDKTIKNAMNDIEKIIRYVYSQGYNDGIKAGKESVQIDDSTAYERGLNDAWECAKKIHIDLSMDKCIEIFEGKSWFKYTASEAMSKIKEYEEKQKQVEDAEIKVGDEVIYHGRGAQIGAHDGSIGVVLGIEKNWVEVRFKSSWNCVGICKDKLTKTGRHFSQIEEVLEQLKGEEE